MIGVVDHGGGNLASVGYALDRLAAPWRPLRRQEEFDLVDTVVFPGVGAAGAAMTRLRESGMDAALLGFLGSGRPYLGICLGMQLLFEESEEDGEACLGLLPGRVARLRTEEKLPHVGWNTIELEREHPLLAGLDRRYFYFTHSFVVEPASRVACAFTWHGSRFVSAVAMGAILGVQFHPERSGEAGLGLLAAFVAGAGNDRDRLAG